MEKIKIDIITYQYSVVVKGIERNLIEEGYEVSVIKEEMAKLVVSTDDATFLFYVPPDVLGETVKMTELRIFAEKVKERKKHAVVISDNKIKDSLLSEIPVLTEAAWVDRPVDTDVLIKAIELVARTEEVEREEKSILVVDDDPAYLKIVRGWLKDVYKVNVVTGGMQAISFLMKNEGVTDLILLDYEMPVVDGPQVLQMLASEPDLADIPIIFLTGVDSAEGVRRVMSLKPAGYLLKSTGKEGIIKYLRDTFVRLGADGR